MLAVIALAVRLRVALLQVWSMAPCVNSLMPIDEAAMMFSEMAQDANLAFVRSDAPSVSATNAPLPNLVTVKVLAATAALSMALAANLQAVIVEAESVPASIALSAIATASIAPAWKVLAVIAEAVSVRVVKFQISVVVGAVAPGIEPKGRMVNTESFAGATTKLLLGTATRVEGKSVSIRDCPLPVPPTIISIVLLKKLAALGLSSRKVIVPAAPAQAVPL